jgi:hypothetical protein
VRGGQGHASYPVSTMACVLPVPSLLPFFTSTLIENEGRSTCAAVWSVVLDDDAPNAAQE